MTSTVKKSKARIFLKLKQSLYDSLHAVTDHLDLFNPNLELALMLTKQVQIGSLPIASALYFDEYVLYSHIDLWWELFSYFAFGLSFFGILVFLSMLYMNFIRPNCRIRILNFSFYMTCVICENLIMVPANASLIRSVISLSSSLPFQCFSAALTNTLVLLRILFLFEISTKSKGIERKSQGKTNLNAFYATVLAICATQISHSASMVLLASIAGIMIYQIYKYQPYYYMPANILMSVGWNGLFLSSIAVYLRCFLSDFNVHLFIGVLFVPCVYIVTKIITRRTDFTIENPYDFELHLRRMLEETEDLSKAVELFDSYKKPFLYFKTMLIWEFYFYFEIMGDLNMALNRLSALRTLDKRFLKDWNRSIRLNRSTQVNDMFDFQIEYFYSKCFKAIDNKQQRHLIHKELREFYSLQNYKKTEKKILKSITNLITNISTNTNGNRKMIEKKLILVNKDAIKMKKEVKLKLKSYGNFNEVMFMYNEFYTETLKLENKLFLQRINLNNMDARTDSNMDKRILALSIESDTVGKIVYSNKPMEELLGYSCSELIGMDFSSLIPEPFDKINEDCLRRFLLFKNSHSLAMSQAILKSKSDHIVGVMYETYLITYNCQSYFYVEFVPDTNSSLEMLMDENFLVLAWNAETENEYAMKKYLHIDSLFPKLSEHFHENDFTFQNLEFKLCEIHVKTKTAYFLKAYTLSKSEIVLFSNEGKSADEKLTREKADVKEEPNSSISNTIASAVKKFKLKKKLKSNIKGLKYTIRIGLLVVIICFIVYIVLERSFMYSISASKLLNRSGLLRYHTANCSKLARTLQLIDDGYSFGYDRDRYNSLLKNSASQLKFIMNEVKESLWVLSMQDSLVTTQVPAFERLNKEITFSMVTLEQFLMSIYTRAELLSNQDFVDKENIDFFYVFRNGASEIVDLLNNLVFSYMDKAKEHYSIIQRENILFSLFLVTPCLIITAVSFTFVFNLERINRQCYKILSEIKDAALREFYSSALLRLQNCHSFSNFFPFISARERKRLYSSIWKKPVLCLVFLNLVCAASSIVLEYVFYYNIYKAMSISGEYYNYGGLRRMLPNLVYFWARESYLIHDENNSYFSIIDNYSFVDSPLEETKLRIEMLREANKITMYSQRYTINDQMTDLYLGHPCNIINLPNCTSSIIQKGLNPALIYFMDNIEGKLGDYDFDHIHRSERDTDDIQTGYVETLNMYQIYEDDVFEENWNLVVVYCSAVYVFFTAFYFVFLFFQNEVLYENLSSKLFFIKIIGKY